MKIAYLITLFVFLSCQNGQIQNVSSMEPQSETSIVEPLNSDGNIATHYKTAEFDVAIFPKEYSEFLPEKRFTPSKQDVDKAENALKTKLKEINKDKINQSSSPIIDKNLKKYKRQYFGCIDENGKKYLLVNSFWSENENDDGWLNGMVLVLDGGSYYWEIKYYLDENELKDLSVNGYA